MEQPSFEGLLHLGALAVVICAGYLGIDRIRNERQTLVAELKAVGDYVRTRIDALAIPADQHVELPPPYRTHAMYVLCFVGEVRLANIPRRSRFASFFCKLWYAPLLRYFRSGADRVLIAIMCLVSFALFECMILGAIHKHWLVTNQLALDVAFAIFTTIVCWVFITAAVSHRLRVIGATCMKLKKKVVKQIEDTLKVDLKKALTDLNVDPQRQAGSVPATTFTDEDDE
jgi:hypothetical protein